ncbi:2-dehydro-3-deoxygluconokinase [Gracilibacillus halotolerans]|uniref:2-dehydro-3-deoxygluconokinase n=1 Tax=Gracilibacillus halotolerans TaxID=74386 RepID=A0A841RMQ2_9BACI|nr:sugar kinase [Gracilibacillus halotolerans]MBB6512214.1 2-dehydro-3-deoxygluconokinase [Gracilibacillus halotolerans]
MKDVVTLGETMVVFTPQTSPMLRYAETFIKNIGGAETNVAIGLSRLGHQVGWISRLGNDEFGRFIHHSVQGEGVDVSHVTFDSHSPTGLYFKEIRNQNDIRVHYYRKNSAASQLSVEDIDVSYIDSAKILHVTGITPALSDSAYEAVIYAMKIAKEHHVKIVFDPNLRRKLWSEDRARSVLKEMVSLSDIVLPGMDEATFLYGEQSKEMVAEAFLEEGAELVIMKLGKEGAYVHSEEEQFLVEGFPVDQMIDPVGAGDGFAAGFISGLLDDLSLYEAVTRANAIGSMQVQIRGDYEGLPNREELMSYLNQSSTEDIKR